MKKICLLLTLMTISFALYGQHASASAFSGSSVKSYLTDMDKTAGTGFTTDIWAGSNNDRGSQVFMPIQADMENDTWSFSFFTAYVYTSLTPDGEDTISMSCITDTKLNMSYTLLDRLPVDMMLGLDLNIPTGKTDLDEDEVSLIMDSDLVSINTFGEGFNINPTLSLVKEWRQWTGSFGVGAVFRGEYDFSSALVNYDPGDICNMSVKVDYAWSSSIIVGMLLDYAYYDVDQAEGEEYYQEGDFLMIGLAGHYSQSNWGASLNLYSIIRGKCKFIADNVLLTEDRKSNGDEWVAGLSGRYVINSATTVTSLLQFNYMNENDYPTDSPYYESERQKLLLGCGITRTNLFFPFLEGHAYLKGFMVNADKAWPVMDEDLEYKGVSIEAEALYRF